MAATAVLATGPRPTGTRRRRPFSWGTPLTFFLALVVAAMAIVPVIYVILGGFRTTGQLAADPAGLPHPWVFSTYANVLKNQIFWRDLGNSTIIALLTTLGVVVLGVCTAFVLARYKFRGR